MGNKSGVTTRVINEDKDVVMGEIGNRRDLWKGGLGRGFVYARGTTRTSPVVKYLVHISQPSFSESTRRTPPGAGPARVNCCLYPNC